MCLAVPGEILSIQDDGPLSRTGRVRFGGIVKEANLTCTPEARVGDFVLVHVGMAIAVIDAAEAARVFEYLEQMNELAELRQADEPAAHDAHRGAHPVTGAAGQDPTRAAPRAAGSPGTDGAR